MNPTQYDIDQKIRSIQDKKTKYTLTLKDFISDYVEIRGVKFTARVNVVLVKTGQEGDIDVDSIELGDMYIFCDTLADNFILLDQVNLKARHRELYYGFAETVEKLAIEKSKTSEWKLDEIYE